LEQINDPKLLRLDFYPNSQDIFKEVAIADGISIVLKDAKKKTEGFTYVYHNDGKNQAVHMNNPGEALISLNPQNEIILQKVEAGAASNSLMCLHDRIFPRNLFGIESNFVEKNPALVRPYSNAEKFDLSNEIKLFTNDKAGKSGRAKWYIANRDVIAQENQKYIGEWQVVVSSANAGGQKRDNQISIIDNHSAFGRVRVALGSFKTQHEAKNFYAYAHSTLIRFLFLMTDESLTSLGKKVPDLGNYTNNNELIDFTKDIDSQLYKLFGLNAEEINFVEATVKPRCNNPNIFYGSYKGCKSTMEKREDGYYILAGSEGCIELMPTGEKFPEISQDRLIFVEQGITEEHDGKIVFIKEYNAKTHSRAAKLLSGSNVSGNTFWKNAKGNPPKEPKHKNK